MPKSEVDILKCLCRCTRRKQDLSNLDFAKRHAPGTMTCPKALMLISPTSKAALPGKEKNETHVARLLWGRQQQIIKCRFEK